MVGYLLQGLATMQAITTNRGRKRLKMMMMIMREEGLQLEAMQLAAAAGLVQRRSSRSCGRGMHRVVAQQQMSQRQPGEVVGRMAAAWMALGGPGL
jgi:hypothetical protein